MIQSVVDGVRGNGREAGNQIPRPLRSRLQRAYFSFNTRRVPPEACVRILKDAAPRAGDLVLAGIESIGQHPRLQLANGRRAELHPESEIVVCYGARYAVNAWEAIVPPTLEPCDLVAAGGVAGRVRTRHANMKKPTRIVPVGLLADETGRPVNVHDFALESRTRVPDDAPPVIAVVGTGMDAGKTTAASALTRGLARGGARVAAIKVTGTGACNDYYKYVDAGAHVVLDFVDAGFVSTYQLGIADLERVFATLVGHAADEGADIVVAEIADGLVQAETEALLESSLFRGAVHGVVLASADALGASTGQALLRERGLPVRAVSGMVSASTLASHETAYLTRLRVLGIEDLANPTPVTEWAAPTPT